ncbi:hypothetical protein EI94DRAFT_1740199 [Lactarius quietus]|nr:hypothetical protein EI94DRAFT_1740199 [Lactarius quietus]
MIRERVATHGLIRPLELEYELRVQHVDPARLGMLSGLWAWVYLGGVQCDEKKCAASMRQISLLRSQAAKKGRAAVAVEGEGWSPDGIVQEVCTIRGRERQDDCVPAAWLRALDRLRRGHGAAPAVAAPVLQVCSLRSLSRLSWILARLDRSCIYVWFVLPGCQGRLVLAWVV